MNRKYVNNPYTVTEKYIATRSAAFDIKGYQLGVKSEHIAQIYGVIVDLAISPNLLGTLICYINGAANVYFNDGGSVENVAVNNVDVAKVSQAFVISTQDAYDTAERVVSYPVPTTNEHFVYFLTRGGIRKIVIDPATVDTNPVHKRLFVGYNAVMTAIQDIHRFHNTQKQPEQITEQVQQTTSQEGTEE
ncbi:hypothetical protein FACS1894132_14040 [Clostridia bacterium]|nr:hypothetical protein FACS1894132_14040 [Clostridia bacterium]